MRAELSDQLLALRALLTASGHGEPGKSMKATPQASGRPLDPLAVCELTSGLRELQRSCRTALGQRGLSMCTSSSLDAVNSHPMLGLFPGPASVPARAAMLASGRIEAYAAAAVLSATLAQAAASTVWGVGPWEHDFASLIDDPPPDEIAKAVALANVEGAAATTTNVSADPGDGEDAADGEANIAHRAADGGNLGVLPDLELRLPLCLDVHPDAPSSAVYAAGCAASGDRAFRVAQRRSAQSSTRR